MKKGQNYGKNVMFLKRFLSMLMVFAMLITSAPITTLASETGGTLDTEIVQSEPESEDTEVVETTETTELQATEEMQTTEDPQSVEDTQILEGEVANIEESPNVKEDIVVEEITDTVAANSPSITVHYSNPNGWSNVYCYSWYNNGSDQLLADGWPGTKMTKGSDGTYTLNYSYTSGKDILVIFNNGNGGDGNQTGNLNLGVIKNSVDVYFTPPVVNGKEVIFNHIDSSLSNADLYIKGDWDGWAGTKMSKNGGVFTATLTVQPGVYGYKFNSSTGGWYNDTYNSQKTGDNSKLIVPGLKDAMAEGYKGEAITLPSTLEYYNTSGTKSTPTVSYVVPEEYAEYVTIENGKITVSKSFSGDTLYLTAKASGVSETSTVTVKAFNQPYTYTIYAHSAIDDRNTLANAGLWIWDEAGETSLVSAEHAFTETEVLADGRTWLKTEIELNCTEEIGFILKSKGAWTWKTKDLFYSNTPAQNRTLYIVDGYPQVYTSLEDTPEDVYLYVEYTNAEGSYTNRYAYAWNNGYTFWEKEDGQDVEKNLDYPVTQIGGKYVAKIPVVMGETAKTVGFIMKKGAGWETSVKDGGDNFYEVPAGEKIVKVRFADSKIKEKVPTGMGNKLDRKSGNLYFYYRDEALFAQNNLAALGEVNVVVVTSDGVSTGAETEYSMTYDSKDDRYEAELKLTDDTDYYYYYKVGNTKVLDAYNKRTGELNGTTYSLRRNRAYNVAFTAELAYPSMSYDDNNVVTVTWGPKTENDDLEGFKIEAAYADLSALGLSARTPFDVNISSEYLELTFGCLDGIEVGTHTIPITVVDDCEMSYTVDVAVNVSGAKADSFNWDEAVIYFAVTDRFFDGDTTNNPLVDTNDTTDGSRYHGGDWKGLTEKIDYLYDLGVNTIWITPIVDNIDIELSTDDPAEEGHAYHGYWTSDFTKLNPHLGSEDEFKALIDAAHAKGMKIMVDIVINHAGYETEGYFNNIIETNAVDGSGKPICKPMLRDETNTIPGDQRMDSLSGLPDFVTEDPEVRAKLIEWQTTWMKEYAIDYYRIDTVKHVDDTTWAVFKNELTKINQDFKIIGEYYDAGFYNDFEQLDTGKMDSVLDFDFKYIMMNLVSENLSAIEEALEDRNTMLTNTATMGSFLSSHDESGFLYRLVEEGGESASWAEALMKVAATFQITAKGQPVIYYGEEIGQTGANNWPWQDNRYDFDWDEQEAQDGTANSMFEHYRKMLNIRKEYSEVFAKGDRSQVVEPLIYKYEGDEWNRTKTKVEQGYEVFSRSYEGTTVYVGVNVFGEAIETTFFVDGAEGDIYTDLYNDETYEVEDGTITISIPDATKGGTAVIVRTSGAPSEIEDTNKITIKLHYTRDDNKYTDWNAWIWGDGVASKQHDFKKEDGVRTATIEIENGRAASDISFRIRKGDWKENDHWGIDQTLDFSDIVSGTIHYYITSGVWGATRVLGADVVTGNRVLLAEYDRNTNTILVETAMPIVGTIENAFTFECTSTNTPLEIMRVEENGCKYTVVLENDLTSMEALLKSYGMTFEGYEYTLNMPNIYSTEEFENTYTYDGTDLGVTYTESATTFKVWAPTADSVLLNIYESGTKGTQDLIPDAPYKMTEKEKGIWEYTLNGDWDGKYYTYTVDVNNEVSEVCDPYARTTGVNGDRAMILDMDSTDPEGWEKDTGAHAGMEYTDAIIYELHVRDLSIDDSSGVSEEHQGKFLGLTETGTKTEKGVPTALDHMIELGVTHLHLLPIYDYASVDESKLDETQYDPQFNWGYDPLNYNVPEGSYSTDPYNGEVRVKELKQAIQALHNNNINVVMDVVYNHVYDAESFAFNQLVPKYFSRTNADGSYSNGSGCGNDTATERSMVHKYVVESILYWHDEYHIDGFRFDLVGLLDTVTINKIVEEVHKKDPDIIFYGEGWTMGTAVSKDGYLMATQANASKTPEFAYFSDTVRNGIAGSDTNGEGFIWGKVSADEVAKYFTATTWWCPSPIQTINYVSCHDNYTLMDKINVVSNAAYNSYDDTPGDYQVSLNNLAAAIYMFSEGIPFVHAGEEFLRTKIDEADNNAIIHNSYNASDEVNKLRWYNLDEDIYKDTSDYYKGLIEFRKNHAALRLSDKTAVSKNVKYHKITDNIALFAINGKSSIPEEVSDGIVVIYNASGSEYTVNLSTYSLTGTWNICVNAEDAGTEVLGKVTDGKAKVAARSALVLVKGETVDNDSVYTSNNKVTLAMGQEKYSVAIDEKITLNAVANPINSTLVWTSSNPSVATVDEEGNVKGIAVGTVTITAETLHGVAASCEVTVTNGIGVVLAGYTLSLAGNIGVNFYMELEAPVAASETAYMEFTLPDGSKEQVLVKDAVKDTELVDGKTYHVFSCEVASDEMTGEIKAQLIVNESKKSTVYSYTVKDYADYIVEHTNTYTTETVALAKAMLNYGAYSQIYFETNTGALANAKLAEAEKDVSTVTADSLVAYKVTSKNNDALGKFTGANLVLESETTLKIYFDVAAGVDVADLTFTINDEAITPVQSGKQYVFVLEDIGAHDLDTIYTFEVTDHTNTLSFECSTMAYCYNVLNREGGIYTTALKNLIAALRLYNIASDTYIAN